MKYAIVYSSGTGNTKILADVIKANLNPEDCIYFGTMDNVSYQITQADLIYVGFWTNQGKCDGVTEEFLKGLYNKKIFLFGSAGFGASQEYFDDIIKRIKALLNSGVEIVDSFICQGRMNIAIREKYERLKKSPVNVPNIDMLIDNFDKALTHPDEDDFKRLIAKL